MVNLRAFRPAFLAGYYVFTGMTVTYTRSRPSYVKARSHASRLMASHGSYFCCVTGRAEHANRRSRPDELSVV